MDHARHDCTIPHGRFLDRLASFGGRLRRAGLPVDASRIALAAQAVSLVGVEHRSDMRAALESVLVSREQDRQVFRALFDAWCRDAGFAEPQGPPAGSASAGEPPISDADRGGPDDAVPDGRHDVRSNAAMAASARRRLRHADFGTLDPDEYRVAERLARTIALPVPGTPGRRLYPARLAGAHARMHWRGILREAAATGGEMLRLPRLQRLPRPLPVLALVDVSGSMERYARMLLAFLHAASRGLAARGGRLDIFAFGTGLTDLTPAFRSKDTDRMLLAAGRSIEDYGGGTRMGESLEQLRTRFAHRLTGGRTLVLLVSDGLDTGDPGTLRSELAWLRRHSRQLLWLNPLMRFEGYEPLTRSAGALRGAAHAMLAAHNLDALEGLAQGVARLVDNTA